MRPSRRPGEAAGCVVIERLDLDPERPSFLLVPGPKSGEQATGSTEVLTGMPKKPRIGAIEESGALSGARAFLAGLTGGPSAWSAMPAVGSADPEIVPQASVAQPSSTPEVKIPRRHDAESDSESEDASEGEEEGEEETGQHVSMDVSLGVLDVLGSTDALLRQGVQEAAGCLPGQEEASSSDETNPLIQEMSPMREDPDALDTS
ncbi:unnamed protein product [Polarella glacialis]|uniref:Uncharacterized protein n=1 Tax=Polarella glacialis TaxID=89957 RepID=A0A813G480_POLGL|nr:unnamed protein product [Polarella glacialis]